MHMLHTILVDRLTFSSFYPDAEGDPFDEDRIRSVAFSCTAEFQGSVFDWRVTQTAGRWSSVYETNVWKGEDHPGKIPELLEQIRSCHRDQEKACIDFIGNALYTIDQGSADPDLAYDALEAFTFLLEIKSGKYNFRSGFYDTGTGTSRITDELIEAVREKPEEYAAVFFDCHW